MRKTFILLASIAILPIQGLQGAGTLKPVGSTDQAIEIRDHHVEVIINNGFAQTRVSQTFFNPNSQDLEAIYAFPVPEEAVLSEMRMTSGETTLEGEVLPKAEADKIYEEEKKQGRETGKADRQSYQRFEFRVTPVRAGQETRMEFVYYQKLEVDSNIGRYLYPLEEGGTDDAAKSFWDMNSTVSGTFSARVELRSTYPVADFRAPNFGGQTSNPEEGRYVWTYQSQQSANLDQDLVLYYRLQDGIPGRVDLLTYKDKDDKEGTFMLTLTPGSDLKPITQGADYMLVLDKSGSMSGKIHTLANGVERALGALSSKDRFRIVVFDNNARELTSDWVSVDEASVLKYADLVKHVPADGGTNLYAGLKQAFKAMDADRLTNLILVTDGVTNRGIIEPAAFDKLMRSRDVRLFGFLLGNNANWPLMRLICEATDGTYDSISNGDDLYGKILMAKDRITTEALLDVDLQIRGVKTHSLARNSHRKLYQGKQLVILGRYTNGGQASLKLKARLTGEDKVYSTDIKFPENDTTYPELERIWAMSQVGQLEHAKNLGKLPEGEFKDAIRNIGVEYQIVTDETSMLLLDDKRFSERGIERRNKTRMAKEYAAQQARRTTSPKPTRADQSKPMFNSPAHSTGSGGGAMEGPFVLILLLSLFALRRKQSR